MIALAVSESVKVTMSNHYYTFGGNIHRQKEGGSIGTCIIGEISRNTMGQWDTKFLSLLRSLGIKVDLYKRYVDDTLKVCPPINKGWIFCTKTKKMIFDKIVFQNDCDEPAVRTAKTINLIANSIEKDIQLTFDLPDFHEDRKMPVLDLKVWCCDSVILYTFC